MADQKKLDRWAEKLLDTGKRNNLINFKDTKASSAEVVYPNCESVFSKCGVGHVFEVFDPKISDDDYSNDNIDKETRKLNRKEYVDLFSGKIKGEHKILVYAQTPNPLTAVKNIAKKEQEMLDETGINVSYLAFGFVRWNEKEGSAVYYNAPLLLVHINIIKGSILDPITIEISDDDIIVNPTFDYLLQAEYGFSLPAFEEGDSLASYYTKAAAAFQKMKWEIIDECKIGNFSFLKINMYEDLKKNADLILSNGNVRAILGEAPVESDLSMTSEPGPVVKNPLIELHTVVDADSSQIEAIEMAKSGKSFVLQGPPGTGKSQTITNIIAECLHDGKKVLFVSEKQAALNVVYNKLKQAGLDDFCLELHSHKANKKAVIGELNRTLEIPRTSVSPKANEEIRQKAAAQEKLDLYAEDLHKKRDGINRSLYQLFEQYAAKRNYPDLNLKINGIPQNGQDYLMQAVSLLEQYSDYMPSVGQNYRENPWYGFNKPEIRFEEREVLKTDLSVLDDGFAQLAASAKEIETKYETPELSYADSCRWKDIFSFLAETDVVTPALLSRSALDHAVPYLTKMKDLSADICRLKEQLFGTYSEEIVNAIDASNLYDKLSGQFASAFTRLFSSDYRNTVAQLQPYVKNGTKIKYHQAVDCTLKLKELQSALSGFEEQESFVRDYLGSGYSGYETDWDHVFHSLDILKNYYESGVFLGKIPQMSRHAFDKSRDEFRKEAEILQVEINTVSEAVTRAQGFFDTDIVDLIKAGCCSAHKKISGCVRDFDKLGNWISFMAVLKGLEDTDLTPFVDAVIREQIKPEDVTGAFEKAFYQQWIEYILFSVQGLSSFTRIKQDQAVQTFAAKDQIQYAISKQQIRSELSQKRPNLNMVAGGSSVAVLRREGQKKRKQMPIRKLLAEIGDLVQLIKPCFLMSPLSVSTFLDSDKISFDTVIFDEASQIFPQDAVGAIYRGKQLIVVGDSKQMPPSDFFTKDIDIDDDDEEIGDVADFESILDICSSTFNTERLNWHYRSHYEQLIAFSNLNFYNNTLVTFPSSSADHKGIGVDYYYVPGVFDRKSRTNKEEAKFIVDLIFKNIEEYPERSLGVVAFSASQQSMIDQLLSKRRESDPSHEDFFNSDRAEPFFVKNLETVQGDERDTIIFSVAYAKDSQGRFIHNFGPLNREGGERRLNVAVTRAKENVQLVASIHYTDINLNNTGAEGVRLLRAYLDYAQNGEEALERIISVATEDHYDSYFEQEVCDFLRDNGFTVDTQVGCSGYRIDLGLRKPNSSNYALAIECDGATYHCSKNARDRDRLRQQVLERMGWKFYRIWSTDWYRNKAVEKERLLQAAREAISRVERKTPVQKDIYAAANERLLADRFAIEEQEPKAVFPKYKELNAYSIIKSNRFDFKEDVKRILETEAPLSEEYLLKRIVRLYDREKVTKAVIDQFNVDMWGCNNFGIIRKNGFMYLKNNQNVTMRVPGDKREIKYISLEELAAGMYTLIKQNVSINKEGLYKTMTNLLGFSRTGDSITERYKKALEILLKSKKVREEDDVLTVL